jgi:hypothetical protein
MGAARVFRVKNFERFQHYKLKDGAPRWIKLYREILVDYEFSALPDNSKAHLMLIWVLASQTDKPLPFDSKWIASRVGATDKIDLESLAMAGFLVVESGLEQESESSLEQIREEEIRGEKKGPTDLVLVASDKDPPLTPEDLVQGWNDCIATSGLSAVHALSETRKKKCKLRLREYPKQAWWDTVFRQIRSSKFLLGLLPQSPSHKNWRLDFDWLIENDTNVLRIYEGKYADGETILRAVR